MTRLLRVGSRNVHWALSVAAVSLSVLLLAAGTHADVTACRNKLQTEVDKLQDALSAAMKTCKAQIGGEEAKGVLTGLGTNCAPGGGCLAAAAHACEVALAPVYDATQRARILSKFDVFRKNIETTREGECVSNGTPCHANAECPEVPGQSACGAVCTDEDIAVKIMRDGTSLGHMLSGAMGYAPPASGSCDLDGDGKADPNCAAKFMIDQLLFATEHLTIRQQLMTDPDTLALFRDAVEAAYGGSESYKATSCSVPSDPATQEFRPNLCRFGTECHLLSCQIDTTGSCSDGSVCDTRNTSGICPDSSPCDTTDPHGCSDDPRDCASTACPWWTGSECMVNNSYVALASPWSAYIQFPVWGGFNIEACEGSTVGSEASNFNVEPGFLYLTNQPEKALAAFIPAGMQLIRGVCLQILRSEGWCDCTGVGLPKDFSWCQDHITSGSGTDMCGAAIDPANLDPTYAGTIDGKVLLTPSGASAAGDCVDLVSMQLSLLTDKSELGPDGLPCTDDDLTVPDPPFNLVLTTGESSLQLFDAVVDQGGCGHSGHCSVDTTQVCDWARNTCPHGAGVCHKDPCMEDINCRQTSFPADTCSNRIPSTGPFNMTVRGAKTSCDNYRANNFSGFAMAGAVNGALKSLASRGLDDFVTAFRFACK